MKGKGGFILLSVLIIQFCVTALVFSPSPHNGGDNAGYITLAHSILDQGSYRELWDPQEPPHTKYPPLFPILLAGAMALGVKGWIGLKAVPFFSTLLGGYFAFLWVRRREGPILAAAVLILLALSDGILDYSRWILSDPTFFALTLGAFWALEAAGTGEAQGEFQPPPRWLFLGFALVVLAYFTRSAGLPLVLATMVWLGVHRWWKALASFLVAFAVPAGLWWWRGRVYGGSEYVAEFWLMDPYRPELGRAGFGGLVARVGENFMDYVTVFIPEGIVGGDGWLLLPLGVVLILLSLLGWVLRLRRNPRVPEFFLPLYAGLMCLWPGVWSGDRFALPLLPLLFFYAGFALLVVVKSWKPTLRGPTLVLAFSVMALPALRNWLGEVEVAGACRAAISHEGPWACYGVNVQEYVLLAGWSGRNLPPQAVVVTRKPRIFYVLSGVKTMSLPLTTDATTFLERAQSKGARYLTADRWDGLAGYYLPQILAQEPGSFCFITAVEVDGEMGIQLLGITPGVAWSGEDLPQCPGEMVGEGRSAEPPLAPGVIPLLARGSGS